MVYSDMLSLILGCSILFLLFVAVLCIITKNMKWIISGPIVILIFLFILPFLRDTPPFSFLNLPLGDMASYGDYIGGTLGGLSVIFILWQIKQQQKQFEKEIKQQKEQFEKQTFETQITNMLIEQNELRNRIRIRDFVNPTQEYTSDQSIQQIRKYITKHCDKVKTANTDAAEAYKDMYFFSDGLSQYFRHLYHILKKIDEATDFTWEERENYTKYLASTLSYDELVLCLYNGDFCIEKNNTNEGNGIGEKTKILMIKYDFLENLDKLTDLKKEKFCSSGLDTKEYQPIINEINNIKETIEKWRKLKDTQDQ